MTKIRLFQIDAFTDKIFSGNPAAVCPLQYWLSDAILQNIAAENNLSETAFYVKDEKSFHIRWFTPKVEVDLCGHATLAAGHVIFNHENYPSNEIIFRSHSGELRVRKEDEYLILNFPTDLIQKTNIPSHLINAFGEKPMECYKGKSDYMLVFDNQEQIEKIKPDFVEIEKAGERGVIITAKGRDVDFVSRFFSPQSGINEDPVTGSAHTTLVPYWTQILNKVDLTAVQLSERKGYLKCKYLNDRIEIKGQAKTYLTGELAIDL